MKWINIKSKIPEKDDRYLVSNGQAMGINSYLKVSNSFYGEIAGITHWAYLPPLPYMKGDKIMCIKSGEISIYGEAYIFVAFSGFKIMVHPENSKSIKDHMWEDKDNFITLSEYRNLTINKILN